MRAAATRSLCSRPRGACGVSFLALIPACASSSLPSVRGETVPACGAVQYSGARWDPAGGPAAAASRPFTAATQESRRGRFHRPRHPLQTRVGFCEAIAPVWSTVSTPTPLISSLPLYTGFMIERDAAVAKTVMGVSYLAAFLMISSPSPQRPDPLEDRMDSARYWESSDCVVPTTPGLPSSSS